MRIFRKLAAALAFVLLPMSGMAATVTFSTTAMPTMYGAHGTDWTVAGGFINIKSTGGDIWLGSDRLGVVKTGGQSAALSQQLNIGETLRFTFASPVTNVTFTRNGGPFPVTLTSYDANGNLVTTISSAYPTSIPVNPAVNGPSNLPILSFLLQGVTGTSAGITSISYEPVAIAPVPVPAAGFLLLGALGMLALRRRKAT